MRIFEKNDQNKMAKYSMCMIYTTQLDLSIKAKSETGMGKSS